MRPQKFLIRWQAIPLNMIDDYFALLFVAKLQTTKETVSVCDMVRDI